MRYDLSTAVSEVYRSFSSVRRPRVIEGCPCCIEDKEIDLLLSKPLREISPTELSSYASSVFLTVGSVADFRYFLPRILDIAASDRSWWPDPEVIGRAMASAGWLTWATDEQRSIGGLFDTVFDQLLRDPDGSELDSWLCGLSRSGPKLAPFLAKLAACPNAVLEFYQWNSDKIPCGQLSSGFWDDALEGQKEVLTWFRSPPASLIVLESYGVDLGAS